MGHAYWQLQVGSANAHGHCYRDTNRDGHEYANGYSYCIIDGNCNFYTYTYTYTYCDRDSDSYRYRDSHGYGHSHSYSHCYSYCYS